MLGPPKTRNLDRPVLFSLESAVPQDHFYRDLERAFDLSFVRDLVADCYTAAGRPSIDPVVFFKLHLILFFEGPRSERQLIEIASLNLAHRWYLGYNLDEPLPDHSSLSKIRTRLGLPVFRRYFEVIVEQCVAAVLVWGKELIFDATKVRANASMESLQPVLHLCGKEVVDGTMTRRWDVARTPYQRLMATGILSEMVAAGLAALHAGTTPRQLRAELYEGLARLWDDKTVVALAAD